MLFDQVKKNRKKIEAFKVKSWKWTKNNIRDEGTTTAYTVNTVWHYFVIGVSSFEVFNEIKFNEILTNFVLKSYYILKAAEREALEKAQERELRRQKEELMNGKVRLVYRYCYSLGWILFLFVLFKENEL